MMPQTERIARLRATIKAERANLAALEATDLYEKHETLGPIARRLDDLENFVNSAEHSTFPKDENTWLYSADSLLLEVVAMRLRLPASKLESPDDPQGK